MIPGNKSRRVKGDAILWSKGRPPSRSAQALLPIQYFIRVDDLMKKLLLPALVMALPALAVVAGCSRDSSRFNAQFEPNLVHAMKYQISEGIPMEDALADANWIVDGMFGTPDEPKLPEALQHEDFADLISLDRIKVAAGPVAEGSGLYRQHCVSCHGVTGNGRGELSGTLEPYPRDYRMGVYKFKSTKRGAKPTRDDLARSIRNGIAGTPMKKIPELSEDDVQALVDYVIYLSIRGELERALLDDAIFELDLEDGERIVDRQFGQSLQGDGRKGVEEKVKAWKDSGESEEDPRAELAEQLELFDDSMDIANDILADLADEWLEAADDVVEVPEIPTNIPVANSHAEFLALSQGDTAEAMAASVKRGQELFIGKIASCSKCHGDKGHGDGQNKDYDDWTKDWTARVGLNPEDTETLIPLMARGAMPPKNAMPRNFSEGVFRGGETAEDLYRRIWQGIEGSPMPGATFVPEQYEEDDIWHLINFVRSVNQAQPESAPTEAG